ncbi:LacI family DNA-binding transcriptional regulator [Salegentibacter sp. F188]|uniref:LacI family DNA-binding transcriptional regulator n=1 Tax=Autumnicola patrickiae TaxID=3075591 RepID=A0ABU3E1G5_9FLAO|nr:LacI family DNA-binding transcriptional regulator [Salegentibacter sp. F188]MDT0689790.1 LacI family DNA-binding transcriptional regulator [Salegentibacter sp. F188]
MKTKITLKELAKLLNVSVSTVSKALNDSPEISPKTVERVKELAALHKYRPNPVAVNLKNSKSGTIGVVIPNISNNFFAQVLSGIEAKAQKEGLQVITYISNESLEREKQIVDMLTSGFVDGVLIAISEATHRARNYDHIFSILEYEIPVVLYDRTNFDIPVDKIGIDDEKSFEEATQLLISKGVKKIGLASGIHHLGVGKLRIKGYEKALLEGMERFVAASSRHQVLVDGIKDLLVNKKVEAMLCTDFGSAMLVYRMAYEFNIKIPQDLKMIGFLNKDVAQYLTPSISFIEQFPEELGKQAMEMLIKRMKGQLIPEKNSHKIINTELVHLESTGF